MLPIGASISSEMSQTHGELTAHPIRQRNLEPATTRLSD